MGDEVLIAWMRLARLPGVGPVLARRLLAAFGGPAAILDASPAALAAVEGIGTKTASLIRAGAAATRAEAQRELDRARHHGIGVLALEDPGYPAALRTIHDPPLVLYVRGEMQRADQAAIGVVGARQCTLYGREMAGRFGRALAEAGLTVVSGGARGIDTCAHEGALLAGGRTVVVQGCGLLHNYPKENSRLYERIVAEGAGAVLSDFPLDMPPLKENFPPRNRIIAGLSLGILVIEANLRSGSLITARLAAADYGREVFALPGRADSPASAGTHHLIKTMVAHLVENVGDILENLGEVGAALKGTEEAAAPEAAPADAMAEIAAASPAAATAAATVSLTADQQRILTAMGSEPTAIDEIIEETGLSVAVVMAQLTLLQIGGVIGRAPRNRFVKGRGAG